MKKSSSFSEKRDTIYTVSNWTVVKKNFVAGIARSAGGWVFNIIILLALVNILIPVFGPKIKQIIDQLPKDLNDIIIQIEKR